MDIPINRASPMPLYEQIAERLRALVASGELPTGSLLPPERTLASQLGVNRSTVLSAYRRLKDDGYVDATVGRGTEVLPRESWQPASAEGVSWRARLGGSWAGERSAMLEELFEMSGREDVVPLSVGLPAPDLLPVDEFAATLERCLGEDGPAAMLHSSTEGHPPLRAAIAELIREREIAADPDEVLVLSGSQQGLDLVARLLLRPGDTVAVEAPTYFGALQVFRGAGARLVGVSVDEHGMRTDLLARVIEQHAPRLIYTLPTYQNPSNGVMAAERREQLLDIAARHRTIVLEDDPYSEIHHGDPPPPPLKALDRTRQVLYLSTFSKTLFPGLRVGFLVAPRAAIEAFAQVKSVVDLHTNTLGQRALERYLREGRYHRHRDRVRVAYASRRSRMLEALGSQRLRGLHVSGAAGGFYVWCRLPEDTERLRLMARASELGVSFLPGWHCFPEDPGSPYVRLTFSYTREENIAEGVRRFLRAVRESSGSSRRQRAPMAGRLPVV